MPIVRAMKTAEVLTPVCNVFNQFILPTTKKHTEHVNRRPCAEPKPGMPTARGSGVSTLRTYALFLRTTNAVWPMAITVVQV